ncbi:hypothetical protein BKA80DRAFT_122715 [Phyllosticta citrichinensis]
MVSFPNFSKYSQLYALPQRSFTWVAQGFRQWIMAWACCCGDVWQKGRSVFLGVGRSKGVDGWVGRAECDHDGNEQQMSQKYGTTLNLPSLNSGPSLSLSPSCSVTPSVTIPAGSLAATLESLSLLRRQFVVSGWDFTTPCRVEPSQCLSCAAESINQSINQRAR